SYFGFSERALFGRTSLQSLGRHQGDTRQVLACDGSRVRAEAEGGVEVLCDRAEVNSLRCLLPIPPCGDRKIPKGGQHPVLVDGSKVGLDGTTRRTGPRSRTRRQVTSGVPSETGGPVR